MQFKATVRTHKVHVARPCERRWIGAAHLSPTQKSAPDGKTSFSVSLNQRGYFQFVGVPPGKHVLAVECPAASAVRELRVQADKETRIDPPCYSKL